MRLYDADLNCLAVGNAHSNRLFVGTATTGVLRSTDGGATFDRIGAEGDRP